MKPVKGWAVVWTCAGKYNGKILSQGGQFKAFKIKWDAEAYLRAYDCGAQKRIVRVEIRVIEKKRKKERK